MSSRMWKATCANWGDWPEEYSTVIPDVLLQHDEYDSEDLGEYLREDEFVFLKSLYSGITEGIEDDPADEVNYMLNKPYKMAN